MRRIALAALLGANCFTVAWAQPAAAPAAAAPVMGQPLGGPVISGVCLLSQEAVVANALVGKAATARLKQISDVAQSEISADRAKLSFDAKAIQSRQAGLKPEAFQQEQLALNTRLQLLEQKAALRNREIEATREKALGRIALATQPVIAEAYKSRNCGLLVNRNSVFGGNFTNDLTPGVVAGLDARITTIDFDKEDLSVIQTANK